MSVINKDLGVVTAYAYAVEAGYTGTEEEFEQALGDLAELVTDFENFTVEVTTLEPGSSATASYADGVLSLGIPEGEKGDTGATPNLTIGTVTTLAPGSDATATITGTDEAPVLSLGIPEGDPGEVPAAALASDFSASVSYKKGDYVWKSGTLYEFTADHAAGAWTGSDATAAKVADDVSNLMSALAIEIQNTVTDVIALTWTENYYVDPADGQAKSNSNREYSNKVSVNPGDVITLYRESDGAAFATIGFIAAYYNDVLIPAKGATSVSNPWTVPNGVDAIIVSIAKAYGNATGDRTYTDTTLMPRLKPDVDTLYNIIAPSKPGRIAYSFDVSANGIFTGTDDFQDECGYRLCFDAKITAITGEVKIGKGIGQTYGGGIGFDGTNLYQYMGTTSNPVRTQAHGLTLKDYVSITLDLDYSSQAIVTISTNGGMYTWTIPVWRSYYGVLTVESVNALTGCVLSYTSVCAKKDIWVFGDSYITYRDSTRWMYYLVQTGHTDYLINGYPGRNSSPALAALKVALKMNHVPKTLIWLLGMNDKDAADAPNSNWLSALTEVIGICDEYHIELILSTIPNVPSESTDNTKKNAWVTSHDYRYIDFANAVSANGSSTWYDGMLSSDNVHPDVQGAIALYNCAVTEVPELLL